MNNFFVLPIIWIEGVESILLCETQEECASVFLLTPIAVRLPCLVARYLKESVRLGIDFQLSDWRFAGRQTIGFIPSVDNGIPSQLGLHSRERWESWLHVGSNKSVMVERDYISLFRIPFLCAFLWAYRSSECNPIGPIIEERKVKVMPNSISLPLDEDVQFTLPLLCPWRAHYTSLSLPFSVFLHGCKEWEMRYPPTKEKK